MSAIYIYIGTHHVVCVSYKWQWYRCACGIHVWRHLPHVSHDLYVSHHKALRVWTQQYPPAVKQGYLKSGMPSTIRLWNTLAGEIQIPSSIVSKRLNTIMRLLWTSEGWCTTCYNDVFSPSLRQFSCSTLQERLFRRIRHKRQETKLKWKHNTVQYSPAIQQIQ